MVDRHIAVYGRVSIEKGYCERCESTAFIIDNKLQCCNTAVIEVDTNDLPREFISEANNGRNRKRLGSKVYKKIIELQNGKCFYCGRKFGSYYTKNGKLKIYQTSVQFDHVIPYSHVGNADHNLVAACNLCNKFKHAKTFGDYTKTNIRNIIINIMYYVRSKFIEHKVIFLRV